MSAVHADSVTIVTGAAGGVGSAVVRGLVAAGGQVVAEDLSPAVEAMASDDVAVVVGDVAESSTAERAVEVAHRRFGRLTGLVNNAGRFKLAAIEETTVEEWDQIMRINARGPFVHIKASLDALTLSRGAVVNTGSMSGLIGLQGQTLYGSTKAAVHQMTRMAAIELASRGIRVNAVAPGHISTGFMDDFLPPEGHEREALLADIAAQHPLGRSTTPDEVAASILFLLSDRAATITGVVLPVDGGYTAT